ncbi:MAG: hypothetical protein SFV54_12120 [Bryobacteraceae bacterium]|nr:hypothetical protein [Bryobacteraceae bacterium]
MANDALVRDVLLLAYRAFDGVIKGKTMLQKRVYFLSVILPAELGYDAHYYGPYSEEVAFANTELKSLGYLAESASGFGVDQRGFEMARYDYRLTDAGALLAERKADRMPKLWKDIESAANVVKSAGNLDYMELSIAAKAYYVLTKLSGKATISEISSMLPKFGWSVTEEQLERATRFLEKADLVTKG